MAFSLLNRDTDFFSIYVLNILIPSYRIYSIFVNLYIRLVFVRKIISLARLIDNLYIFPYIIVLLVLYTLLNKSNLDTTQIVAAVLIINITFVVERSNLIRLFILSIVILELVS